MYLSILRNCFPGIPKFYKTLKYLDSNFKDILLKVAIAWMIIMNPQVLTHYF